MTRAQTRQSAALTGLAEPSRPSRAMRRKASVATGALLLAMLALMGRFAQIQLMEHERLASLALQQQTVERSLSGRRGNIYDSAGRLLATSVKRWSVFADPAVIEHPRATALLLSRTLDVDAAALGRKLKGPGRFAWVKRQVHDADAEAVRRLNLRGVHLRREYRRVHPTGRLCGHIIGFTDIDGRGLAGIELELDRLLRSRAGREELRCDAARRIVRRAGDDPQEEPADGYDVYLTLDAFVQNVAREELLARVAQHGPECAWAIVLDTRTGAVLANVVTPEFDPNTPGESDPAERRNRTITDAYEFGSIMKPLAVAAAIQEGLVTPRSEFYCHQGAWRVGRRTVHDVSAHGTLTVSEIVAYSSNIGAAQIGMLLGPERFYRSLRRFGFGEPTGIDLPGEINGIIRPVERWTRDSLISVAFGQEIATTPLSTAFAFAALANDGLLLRPQIIDRIVETRTGRVVYERRGPQVRRRVVSERTAAQVMDMMRRVVQEGTGKRARLDDYPVAGKSGTASLLRLDGRGYSDKRYLSSFVATAPADSPRVLVLVSLKAPSKGSNYGGVVAAPACREILRRTLRYMNVPPRVPGRAVAEAAR